MEFLEPIVSVSTIGHEYAETGTITQIDAGH